ncbi:MAG TPA: DNA methyltransferase, partial [Hyphomicrobiales bacterium]|nr:DNA methyltransferase [Hyphomicrobiales bacterium]
MRHERDITAAAETFLDGRCSILVGDVRARLRELPDDHFDCVVTSPPYWGLRDYGVEGQLGMEPSVGAHLDAMMEVFEEVRRVLKPSGTCWVNYGDCYATTPNGRSAAETKASGGDDRTFRDKPFSTVGPVGGLGLGKGGGGRHGASKNLRNGGDDGEGYPALRVEAAGYLKPKDLVMMPNRFAIAMQDAGWWVRSEIVWGKPNGMPDSSGRFRPATAHEKIFLFTKSDAPEFWVARDTGEISQDPDFSEQVVMVSTITDKCPEGRLGPRWIALGHYYDAEAVRLPATPASIQRWSQDI